MITFEVFHLESNDNYSETFYKGKIEAESLDKAIEIFKTEWLEEGYKGQFDETDYQNDERLRTVTYQVDSTYSDIDGNDLNDEQLEELRKTNNMHLGELIDNEKIGYLDHYYEITAINNGA